MEIVLKEKAFNGNKYRFIKDGKFYYVTTIPQKLQWADGLAVIDGTYDYENEHSMGGWPGSHSTDFDNLKEAEICFDVLVEIGNDEDRFFKYIDISNDNFPNE